MPCRAGPARSPMWRRLKLGGPRTANMEKVSAPNPMGRGLQTRRCPRARRTSSRRVAGPVPVGGEAEFVLGDNEAVGTSGSAFDLDKGDFAVGSGGADVVARVVVRHLLGASAKPIFGAQDRVDGSSFDDGRVGGKSWRRPARSCGECDDAAHRLAAAAENATGESFVELPHIA